MLATAWRAVVGSGLEWGGARTGWVPGCQEDRSRDGLATERPPVYTDPAPGGWMHHRREWWKPDLTVRVWLVVLWCIQVALPARAFDEHSITDPGDDIPCERPDVVCACAGREGGAYWEWFEAKRGAIARVLARAGVDHELHVRPTEGAAENYIRVAMPSPRRGLRDPRICDVALIQMDVAAHSALADGKERGYPVRGLAKPFAEVAALIVPRHRADLRTVFDIERIGVGSPESGSFFTWNQLTAAWLQVRAQVTADGTAGIDTLQKLQAGEVDASFRVARSLDHSSWRIGTENRVLPLGKTLQQWAVIQFPYYRRAVVPHEAAGAPSDAETTGVPTLAVDTLLVARMDLPGNIGHGLIDVVTADESDPGIVTIPADERLEVVHIPKHPALIEHDMGPYPFLDISIALVVSTGILVGLFVASRRVLAPIDDRLLTRREQNRLRSFRTWLPSLAAIAGAAWWTFLSCWLIKWLEAGIVLQGSLHDDGGIWSMDLFDLLTWLSVFASTGYEQDIFPISKLAKFLAASVQLVGVGAVLYVAGRLSFKVIEDIIQGRQQAGRNVMLSDHVVICHWRPEARVILDELRGPMVKRPDGSWQPIVIVAENAPEELADAYESLLVVGGDPTDRIFLERASVGRAETVFLLRADEDPAASDAKVTVTYMEVTRQVEAEGRTVYTDGAQVIAEVCDVARAWDLSETGLGLKYYVTQGELDLYLLAQTAATPGVTRFFDQLLETSDKNVELYDLRVPSGLVGRRVRFGEVVLEVHRQSVQDDPTNPVLVVGYYHGSNGLRTARVNPYGEETAVQFDHDDRLLVMAWRDPENHEQEESA